MKITFENKAAKQDALVVFASPKGKGGIALASGAKSLDRSARAAVAKAAKAEAFTAKLGEILSVPSAGRGRMRTLLVVGIGSADPLTGTDVEKIGSAIYKALQARKVTAAVIERADDLRVAHQDAAETAARLALSLRLSNYRFDKYLTRPGRKQAAFLKRLTLVTGETAAVRALAADDEKIAAGVFLARDLAAEAPNVLYPESFADIIRKELTPLGVKVRVLDVKEMEKLDMGALLSVGQGSARPPRLVSMVYDGGDKGARPVALVGKGITFDTGGISLKPGPGMEDMKWDMAGAGAVVGAMKALAGRRARANIVGIVALAENMPSGTASRPGDIVTTMSGQTVEILNTDAEGRLVLCDALTYVQRTYKPTHIVDLATLTGAVLVALGEEYAGAFSNDDTMISDLLDAGEDVGEQLWHLPLNDHWDKSIDSPAADIKNIAGNRNAGSSIGAHFLKRFIEKGVKWSHLDIAGMAWASRERPSVPKGPSGFGVRLLDRYIASIAG